MSLKTGYVDFSTATETASNVVSYDGGQWKSQYCCRKLTCGRSLTIRFALTSTDFVRIQFNLCAVIEYGDCYCPLDIKMNDEMLQENFYPDAAKSCGFYDVDFAVPPWALVVGENTVTLTVKSGSVFIKRFVYVVQNENRAPLGARATRNWQEGLPNRLYISEVSLPGTHDTAAISSFLNIPKRLYDTQNLSITKQLNAGIRALDLRISVKYNHAFSFDTCHGSVGSSVKMNIYQSLESALKEIRVFLTDNPSEFIVIKLQIDDWACSVLRDRAAKDISNTDLAYLLHDNLPVYDAFNTIPTVGEMRGKVFLIQTITADPSYELGSYLTIPDNSHDRTGLVAVGNYKVFVQDNYNMKAWSGNTEKKWEHVKHAIEYSIVNADNQTAYVNFASGVQWWIMGTYVHEYFVEFIGSLVNKHTSKRLGWIFWDFPNRQYIILDKKNGSTDVIKVIDLIISSNFSFMFNGHDFREPFLLSRIIPV